MRAATLTCCAYHAASVSHDEMTKQAVDYINAVAKAKAMPQGPVAIDEDGGTTVLESGSQAVPPPPPVDVPMLHKTGGQLAMTMPLFPLDADGYFDIPRNSTLLLEVGTHAAANLYWRLRDDPTVVVFGFEPDPLQFAKLQLKQEFSSRFRVFPVALGQRNRTGFQRLFQWTSKNSLNKNSKVDETELGSLMTYYDGVLANYITVPVITLADVLECVHPDVRIELIKVDAQGLDLEIVRSAEHHLQRVERIQMEVAVAAKMYLESEVKSEVAQAMSELGFEIERCWKVFNMEEDCVFARSHVLLPSYHESECFPDDFAQRVLFVSEPKTVYQYADLLMHISDRGYESSGYNSPEGRRRLVSGMCCDPNIWPTGDDNGGKRRDIMTHGSDNIIFDDDKPGTDNCFSFNKTLRSEKWIDISRKYNYSSC